MDTTTTTIAIENGYATVAGSAHVRAVETWLGQPYSGHDSRTYSLAQIGIAALAQEIRITRSEYGDAVEPRLDLLHATEVRVALHRAGRRAQSRAVGSWQRQRAYSRASATLAGASSATHTYAILAASQPRSLDEIGERALRAVAR